MTTRSMPEGNSVSACHTMAGSVPDTSLSVRAMSRSRLMPGKTTTADFIGDVPSTEETSYSLAALRRLRSRRQRRPLLDLHDFDEIVQRLFSQFAVRRR